MVYDMGPRFESDVMFLMSPNMGLTVDSESQPEGAWSVVRVAAVKARTVHSLRTEAI